MFHARRVRGIGTTGKTGVDRDDAMQLARQNTHVKANLGVSVRKQ